MHARERVLDAFHREYLTGLLVEHSGRIGAAARAAGVNARTLYQLMKKHDLRKEDFRISREKPTRSRTSRARDSDIDERPKPSDGRTARKVRRARGS